MILIQSWQDAEKPAFAVRQKVFIQEQGVPEELELDEELCGNILKSSTLSVVVDNSTPQ